MKKMKYTIKSIPADDVDGLQNLLNEMSMSGWELYSMSEVETDENIMLNCIFVSEDYDGDDEYDGSDILGWGTVKNPIEKMLSPDSTPYERCLEIISKIKAQKKKINRIKTALDVEDPASDARKKYNDKISSSLKELEVLKKEISSMANPAELYKRLGVDSVSILVSEELIPLVDTDSEEDESLLPELMRVRYENTDKLGYIIPPIRILDTTRLSAYEFSVNIRGTSVFKAFAYPHHKMFFVDDLNLTRKMKDAIYDVDFITGKKVVWIDERKTKDYWTKGISATEFISRVADFVLIKYVDDIFTYESLQKYCRIVAQEDSFLVENLVPDMISFADLKYILTSLIRERVSIKDIVFIFEKLNDYAQSETRADMLSKLRLALSRNICQNYVNSQGVIPVLEISDKTFNKIVPEIDEIDAIVKIDANFAEKIANKIVKKVNECDIDIPILVVPMEYRQIFFGILSNYINDIVVLAQEEFGCNFEYESLGEI